MTQPAGTVTNSISTIGPAPDAPDGALAQNASSEESAGAAPSGAAPPAPPPPSSPTPPEEGKEPAPDPSDLTRRAESLARGEARFRKRDVEFQQRATTLDEREKQIAAREAEWAEFEADPVAYALKKNKDPVEWAKRFARPETEEQKRIRQLEERDRKREEEAKQRAEEEERQRAMSANHAAMRNFVSSITPEECPTLVVEYEPHEVPTLVSAILHREATPSMPEDRKVFDLFVEEHGRRPTALQLFQSRYRRNPSDDEMRVALEQEASSRATSRRERGERYKPKPPLEQQPVEDKAQPAATGPSSISNQHAATTSSASKRSLSLEERRARDRRKIVEELEGEGGESS